MTVKLYIDDIDIPRHRRAFDASEVAALAASIKEIGMHTPISVRKVRKKDGQRGGFWRLVAGRRRIAALKKLGETRIEANEFVGDEIDADLWEIAENLHRGELSGQERADAIAEWVATLEKREAAKGISTAGAVEIKPKSKSNPKGAGRPQTAMAKVAKELGVSKDKVQESVRISKITPAAREAADKAKLNSHKERLAIARVPPSKQLEAIKRMSEAEKLNDIATVWDRASRKVRYEFALKYQEAFNTALKYNAS